MTTKELINQYVTAHADNRWMDASELEALLTEFAEKLKEPASEELEQATEKAIRWFENIAYECDKLTSGNVAHLKTQIKGLAIRSAEYLTKHSQEPTSRLTWQDIQRIVKIADQIVDEDRRKFMAMEDEDYYKEVLARYVKQSEKP